MKKGLRIAFGTVLLILSVLLGLSFLAASVARLSFPWSYVGLFICLSVIFLLKYYKKLKTNRKIRIVMNTYIGLLTVGIIYMGFVSTFMISAMLNTPQAAVSAGTFSVGQPQTVIVLGCQTLDGRPSAMLKARLDKAAEYLADNPDAVCIASGGQGGNEIEPEAVTMERYLITKGIDKNRIYTEENSTNTQENIKFSAEIIEKENLPEAVVVVSEGYHLYRAGRQAEKNGLSALTLAADSHSAWYALPSCWLRETLAITRDYAVELFS